MPEEKFITVEKAVQPGLFCVEVRQWNAVEDGYIITQCSRAMTKEGAKIEAGKWSTVMGLEIR